MSYEQTGFLGLCGDKVDAIDFYASKIEKLSEEVSHTLLSILSLLMIAYCDFLERVKVMVE